MDERLLAHWADFAVAEKACAGMRAEEALEKFGVVAWAAKEIGAAAVAREEEGGKGLESGGSLLLRKVA